MVTVNPDLGLVPRMGWGGEVGGDRPRLFGSTNHGYRVNPSTQNGDHAVNIGIKCLGIGQKELVDPGAENDALNHQGT